ncbi:D-inositol-3-phosphate glycosyltransferase [subsurface metagenome]
MSPRIQGEEFAQPLRLAILQRVCAGYQVGLFRRLSDVPGGDVRLFIGDDIPGSKVRSAADLSSLDVVKLPTRFIRLGGRLIPLHKGLQKELEIFQPHVILCEGESNFLNYVSAIWYRWRHRQVGLVHWSLGGMPGVEYNPRGLLSRAKYFFQKSFDIFVVYSSFGKDVLIRLGHPAENIVVATNVSDTEKHLQSAAGMSCSRSEARAQLNLPDKFTVIYAGAMDANKRLDQLLMAAADLDSARYNFVLLGSGGLLEQLRSFATARGLKNIFFPGRVGDELPLYYNASNVLALPGRGGIVISEAMTYALPVIVFQADGTEYDLVQEGVTGIRLKNGDAADLRLAIEFLYNHPAKAEEWGARGQQLVRDKFTIATMIEQLMKAVYAAYEKRLEA